MTSTETLQEQRTGVLGFFERYLSLGCSLYGGGVLGSLLPAAVNSFRGIELRKGAR